MMLKKIFIFLFITSFTLVSAQETYYNDVNLNLSGISLKNALATKIIATHTNLLFYTPGVWEASKATDVNPDNSSEVLLIYGWENGSDGTIVNDRERGINNNGGSSSKWNREHVFARSLGNPNLGTEGAGADAHNLRPADVSTNSSRSNKKFATGSGNSGNVTGGWYPGDEWKGDVARMMMYMYLRYGNRCLPTAVGVGSNISTPDNMIDLFLNWNAQDPVSDFEKQRNAFHENTNNNYAQGNRNPFIDNPFLATRIWGGSAAEDTWIIFTGSDDEAPTTPTNVTLNNITTSSINVSWRASTDNVQVTSYDVLVNGNFKGNTSNTNYSITGLVSNTTFIITIIAKDIVDNKSVKSTPINGKTLVDNTAPTVPTNIIISNKTDVTFKITWLASTDDTGVTGYDIYIDGVLKSSTDNTLYTVTGLMPSTTYRVSILSKDAVNNQSAQSIAVNATTTDGSVSGASELFFSEYVEGSGNNKALEIANVTNSTINLSGYTIKRQRNGGGEWSNPLDLSSGTIKNIISGDVFVVINGAATNSTLIAQADIVVQNREDTNYGAPVNFNGNDPVGLFKNDVLIDIIGVFNGGSANFAKDKTLRRKSTISSPNTTYDFTNEWNSFAKDIVDGIGNHSSTLLLNNFDISSFKIYPNLLKGNILNLIQSENKKISKLIIFNIIGKKLLEIKNPTSKINLSSLHSGLYIIKIISDKKVSFRKIVKK